MASIAEAFVTMRPDFDKFGAEAQSGISGTLAKVALGAAGAGVAIGAVALKFAGDFDAAYDRIRISTGATGDVLAGLENDFKAVATSVPAGFDTISEAVGGLNQRLGITGEPLQKLATQLVNLSRITETDVNQNVKDATRLFGDWSIASEDQSGALDKVFRASQTTGIGVNQLMQGLVQFGAPLRQMGFSFEESAALMGKWEKEGVNSELVLGSLRIAMGHFAKENIPMREGLEQTIARIREMGPGAAATTLAMETFGARAGPDMAAAILEGRFAIGEYLDAIENGSDTINQAASDTDDWREKMELFKNRVLVGIEPLLSKFWEGTNRLVDGIGQLAAGVGRFLDGGATELPGVFDGIAIAIGKIIQAAGDLVEGWRGITDGGSEMSRVGEQLRRIWDALPTILEAVGAGFRVIIDPLSKVVGWLLGLLTPGGDAAGILQLIADHSEGAGKAVGIFLGILAVEALVNFGTALVTSVVSPLKDVYDAGNKAYDALKQVTSKAWQIEQKVVRTGEKIIEGLADTVQSITQKIIHTGDPPYDTQLEMFKDHEQTIKQKVVIEQPSAVDVSNVGSGIAEGLASKIAEVLAGAVGGYLAVSGVGGSIVGGLTASLATIPVAGWAAAAIVILGALTVALYQQAPSWAKPLVSPIAAAFLDPGSYGDLAGGVANLLLNLLGQAIGTVAAGVVLLVVGVPYAIVNGIVMGIQAGGPAVAGAMGGIASAIGDAIPGILGFFTALPGQIGGALQALPGVIAGIMAAVLVEFTKLPGQVQSAIQGIPGAVTGLFNQMQNLPGLVSGILAAVLTFFTGLPGQIEGAISGIPGIVTGIFDSLPNPVQAALSQVGDGVQSGWNRVNELTNGGVNDMVAFVVDNAPRLIGEVATWPGRLISALGDLAGQMAGKGAEIISGLLSGITDHVGDLLNYVFGIPGQIVSQIPNPLAVLSSVGSQIIQGLINGITGRIGDLAGAVGNAIAAIPAKAMSLLGIHSPSTVFQEIGEATMEGLALGIDSQGHAVTMSLANWISVMQGQGADWVEWGNTAGADFGNAVIDGVNYGFSSSIQDLHDVAERYFGFIVTEAQTSVDGVGDVWNDWLTHFPPQMREGALAAGKALADGLASVQPEFRDALAGYLYEVINSGDAINASLEKLPPEVLGIATQIGVELVNGIKAGSTNLGTALNGIVGAVQSAGTAAVAAAHAAAVAVAAEFAKVSAAAAVPVSAANPPANPAVTGQLTQAQIDYIDYMNRIQSYDTGIGFVPNDQLAYIHRGEAVLTADENRRRSGTERPIVINATVNIDGKRYVGDMVQVTFEQQNDQWRREAQLAGKYAT